MRATFLLLSLCSAIACHSPESSDCLAASRTFDSESIRAAEQLALNQQAWQEHGTQLAVQHPGVWVLIARGEVLGNWTEFDQAWAAAQQLEDEVRHAYLYRAGIDDLEPTFRLSPFSSQNPHWVQLGVHVRIPWKLTIAAVDNHWYSNGKDVAWGSLEARVLLENVDRSKQHTVRAVASNLFEHDLTLRLADAAALGLGRFTAPNPAFWNDRDHPCQKVLVRVRIPELDIHVPVLAYILPQSAVDSTQVYLLDKLMDFHERQASKGGG